MIPTPGFLVDTPDGLAAVTAVNRWPDQARVWRGDLVSAVTDDGTPVLGRWLQDVHPAREVAA